VARRNIYVRDEDADIWSEAEGMAGETALSRVVSEALRAYVRSRKGNPMNKVTVYFEDETPKAFVGRWLISPDDRYESVDASGRSGTVWAVAETAKGNVAVCRGRPGDPFFQRLDVYESLEEMEDSGIPEEVVSRAAVALGIERAELLDI